MSKEMKFTGKEIVAITAHIGGRYQIPLKDCGYCFALKEVAKALVRDKP